MYKWSSQGIVTKAVIVLILIISFIVKQWISTTRTSHSIKMTLKAILSLCLILVCVKSQDPDMPNYFVDIYEASTYYAYPPHICIQTGVLTYGYFMYECLAENDTYYMQRTVSI